MENQQIEFGNGVILFTKKDDFLFLHNCNTDSCASGGRIVLTKYFNIIGMNMG